MENKVGWIKLHRSILDTPDWLSEKFTRAQAWVDLLLLANFDTGYITKRGIKVCVDRGQIGYSEDTLAVRWKWSRGKVRRFLADLKSCSQIESKISTKTVLKNSSVSALISIKNYDRYQSNGTEDSTENSTEDGTREKKNKEEKEEKEIILINKKSKKPEVIKTEVFEEVFLTDEQITKLKGRYSNGDYEKALEELSIYKMSHNVKYASDYHVLYAGWVYKKIIKENATKKGSFESIS